MGKYHGSGSGLVPTSWHFRLINSENVLVFNTAKPPVDPTLLLRAFAPESWYIVLGFVFLGMVFMTFLHLLGARKQWPVSKWNLRLL